jgi:hypothetical protein
VSKWFNLNKYYWFSPDLEKKFKVNNYITYAMAILALICLYVLPNSIKFISILFMVVGAYLIYKNTGIQSQDKQLKITEELRRKKLAQNQEVKKV